MSDRTSVSPFPLARIPAPTRWAILVVLSATLAALFTLARLPAALLLGPMVAAILVENGGAGIRVPPLPFYFAQAIIGCMIARTLTPGILHSFLLQWPLFLGLGLVIIFASCGLGWGMSKLRILPETTAIWGLLPGAASAMLVMADAYGADSRLVAFMQYLRVAMVVALASVVARFWVHTSAAASVAVVPWFAPIHALPFLATLAVIIVGVALGRWSRLAAGVIMITLCVAAVLQGFGILQIELPRWLLAASYALIGWNVGLRFTREVLIYAARAIPQIMLAILALMLFCGGLAWLLVQVFGIDPLTAYLATSPGGADSVAVVAASTKVDVGFIMAQQIVRFLLVLLIGPIVSRFAADQVKGRSPTTGRAARITP